MYVPEAHVLSCHDEQEYESNLKVDNLVIDDDIDFERDLLSKSYHLKDEGGDPSINFPYKPTSLNDPTEEILAQSPSEVIAVGSAGTVTSPYASQPFSMSKYKGKFVKVFHNPDAKPFGY